MAHIRLNEALKIMETGDLFSIKFVTFDKKRKTGGAIKYYPECKLLQSKPNKEKIKKGLSTSVRANKSKKPNHWDNATRNIKVVIDGTEVSSNKKLHIFLILELNGKRVNL